MSGFLAGKKRFLPPYWVTGCTLTRAMIIVGAVTNFSSSTTASALSPKAANHIGNTTKTTAAAAVERGEHFQNGDEFYLEGNNRRRARQLGICQNRRFCGCRPLAWESFSVLLDGCTYDQFSDPMDAQSRLDWLGKHPREECAFPPRHMSRRRKRCSGWGMPKRRGKSCWKRSACKRRTSGLRCCGKSGGGCGMFSRATATACATRWGGWRFLFTLEEPASFWTPTCNTGLSPTR